jgi:hypothetical protein
MEPTGYSLAKLGETLQSLPRQALYLILFIVASVPLFFPIPLPNNPDQASIDYYAHLMELPAGSKVLICSDWTNGTRGESMGEMDATLRILMRKKVKFAVSSIGDGQAPKVARDDIARISVEEGGGTPLYKPWQDYVIIGYFPNGEGETTAINTSVLKAFAGKTDTSPNGQQPVVQSPVFEGIKSLSDFKYLIQITPSSTYTVVIERIKKAPLMFAVTGVMVPENQVYYASGQLKGLLGGIKGVYDMETLMEYGVNNPGPHMVVSTTPGPIPGFPGMHNAGKGTAYYPALHVCLAVLILAVFIGNLGMFLARKRR